MEVTSAPLEWNSNDAIAWREFLKTPTGLRLIPKIVESTPALLSKGDVNEILIRSGEVRGFQAVIQTALTMTTFAPSAPSAPVATYPPLEDDSKWDDGQRLE